MTKKRLKAFTLVELLVVISIIAMLLAILTPSLRRARNQAKKVVCLSNMRQMSIGLKTYLMSSDDHLPDSSCHISDPNQYWLVILSKYLSKELLSRCPTDTAKNFVDWSKPLEQQGQGLRWSSFALNALLDSKCLRHKGKYNSARFIYKPQYCIYVSESPSSWTSADHVHPEVWGYNIKTAKGHVAWDRHSGKSNYVFTDGHAETLEIEKTYSWPGNCFWFPESAPGWPPDD